MKEGGRCNNGLPGGGGIEREDGRGGEPTMKVCLGKFPNPILAAARGCTFESTLLFSPSLFVALISMDAQRCVQRASADVAL